MTKINLVNFLVIPKLMGIVPDLRRDERNFAIDGPVFTISCPQPSSSLTSNVQLHLEEFLKDQ